MTNVIQEWIAFSFERPSKGKSLEDQMSVDVESDLLNLGLPILKDGDIGYFITHSGYVDYDLFRYALKK